jgi:hypothetical protein
MIYWNLHQRIARPKKVSNYSLLYYVTDLDVVQWPKYTQIQYSPGGSVLLTRQEFQLKLILRQAIFIVEGQIIFDHPFPDLADRAILKRKALLNAISFILSNPATHARETYKVIKQRVKADATYSYELTKVVCDSHSLHA